MRTVRPQPDAHSVQTAGFIVAMLRADSPAVLAESFALVAVTLEPTLLSTLCVLYAANRQLARLPYPWGCAVVVAIAAGCSAGFAPLASLIMVVPSPWSEARGTINAALLAGMLLAYFNLRDRAFSPALAEARLPATLDLVTALHACDTATDDAIRFALHKQARYIVLAPCCQAEVATVLRKHKGAALADPRTGALTEAWRHPLHTREFGSHITNVLRCLQLEAHGYQVNVTELVGWEHSLKNELIIASQKDLPRARPARRLHDLLEQLGLTELQERFSAA